MNESYYGDCWGEDGPLYLNLNGRPVERTPMTHPYSYDEFVIFKSKRFEKTDCMVYHDRMMQWSGSAFSKAVREVWPDKPHSQMFSGKKPEDINRFLNLYFGKEVELTAVLQGCNVGNGFPYWIFAYKELEREGEE